MCSGKDRRYASLRISYLGIWCIYMCVHTRSRRGNIGTWRTILYVYTYTHTRVSVACTVRSVVLSPRARLRPVKISISVEHSIVMAMCLSSYGRSSSAAEAQIAPCTCPTWNKWKGRCVCEIRKKRREELFLG